MISTAVLRREILSFLYYFILQFEQIYQYWLLGIVVGSLVSVFGKEKIHGLFCGMRNRKLGLIGIIPACLLGIASPLCMYGTILIAASFSGQGVREDWLAAFMMASILLNPQLIVYSIALGGTVLVIRIVSCFFCGIAAGLLVALWCKDGRRFFSFQKFREPENHDTAPNLLVRLLKNIGRNLKATGPWFLLGVLLSALFQRYVPSREFAALFGENHEGFGVLMAATIGVPLYVCGGGTIPLLQEWLRAGMSLGSAASFMLTGPATKITNLGALKIVLGKWKFAAYLMFVVGYALLVGLMIQ